MSRPQVSVLLFLMMVAAAAQGWFFAGSLIDDAFIFFRYADNLLAGLGPVFNAGERVEGFTSPLWLLLLAAMDLLLAIAGVLSARPLQEVR